MPFYLIPQVLAREMKRYGSAISEVYIYPTQGHFYLITLVMRGEEP
ncbi:hypothetical protein J2129_000916 [Methanofollis sp. W23]|nr:hypothetical protein [Methanofollis sp. W23]MBP2145462.1 hypothetical protein [Methanofollis sp. W23]